LPGVLVVDSDVVLRNTVRDILQAHGFEALDAASAEEAITVCQSPVAGQIDVVIIEESLKCKYVAEQVAACSANIKILLTSQTPQHALYADERIPAGAAFLQKPFFPEQLIAAVKSLIQPRIQ